ncbi:MAG: mannose/fructose/sorbose PTS transporter subunit IIA [Sporolactobacillus sp.]
MKEQKQLYSLIVCAHGDFAESLKRSVEMIFGKADTFFPVRFVPGENLEDIKMKINTIIQTQHLTHILVLTDLFGGSPYNAAATLAYQRKDMDVVSGVNLPICLEAVANQTQKSLNELVPYLQQIAADSVKSFKSLMTAEEEDQLL